MALAVDVPSTATAASTNSLTWAHTCTGSALILVVGLWHANGDVVTGVTYNGVAMTQAKKAVNVGNMTCYVYYLINPATGNHNIIASASVSNSFGGGAVSFTGADQVTGIGATASSVAALSQSISTTVANSYLIAVGTSNSSGLGSAGAGQTDFFAPQAVSADQGGGSYKAATTVTSYTLSYTGGGGSVRGIGLVEILPDARTTFTKTASASVSRAASRAISLARIVTYKKTVAASVSNAVSRLASVVQYRFHIFTKTASASVSNAASRFVTVIKYIGWRLGGKSTDSTNSFGGKSADSTNAFGGKSTDSTNTFTHKS